MTLEGLEKTKAIEEVTEEVEEPDTLVRKRNRSLGGVINLVPTDN